MEMEMTKVTVSMCQRCVIREHSAEVCNGSVLYFVSHVYTIVIVGMVSLDVAICRECE